MHINWLNVARYGAAMANIAIHGVQAVETLAEQVGGLTGQQKEDAVVALVKQGLITAEGLTAKDLVDNAAVEAALRDVIKAVHDLHAVIASTHAGAAART